MGIEPTWYAWLHITELELRPADHDPAWKWWIFMFFLKEGLRCWDFTTRPYFLPCRVRFNFERNGLSSWRKQQKENRDKKGEWKSKKKASNRRKHNKILQNKKKAKQRENTTFLLYYTHFLTARMASQKYTTKKKQGWTLEWAAKRPH